MKQNLKKSSLGIP